MSFGTFGKAFPRDPGGHTRKGGFPPQVGEASYKYNLIISN